MTWDRISRRWIPVAGLLFGAFLWWWIGGWFGPILGFFVGIAPWILSRPPGRR